MAGVRFRARTTAISTGTAAKTLLQVIAASNHGVMIDEIEISFNGTSNTAEPIRVDLCRQSDAGTTTAADSSNTIVKDPDDSDETIQTTIRHTATVEPTTGDILRSFLVHPQTGHAWQAPFGRGIKIGGGDRLGVRVTAPASVSAMVTVAGEE